MRALTLVLLLAACTGPVGADTDPYDDDRETGLETDEPDTDIEPATLEVFRLAPPAETDGAHTATHLVCANCHTAAPGARALKDAAGRSIGAADLWPASMMAHSSRDPIFRTAVAVEKAQTPALAAAIEQKCLSCHAPAAWADKTLSDEEPPVLADLVSEGPIGDLAREGATCVTCHLQEADSLGDASTFSGRHDFNDQRVIYGPHAAPFAGPMRNFAGFEPTQADHMDEGALCASCHTLQTDAVTPEGEATGHALLEQGPFLEWQSSDFYPPKGRDRAASCQTCHVPNTDEDGVPIRTRIARNPSGADFPRTYDRQPVSRHLLYGGNAFVLELLRDHRELVGSPSTEEGFAQSIAGTRAFLQQAASLALGEPGWDGDTLVLPVTVLNETGHKLPTGYPSRRVWLEVEVTDATGAVVWHVGATDARGRIIDGEGQPIVGELDGAIAPHRQVVAAQDEPVVWEAVMAAPDGTPTTTLLRGSAWAKDSRLLPAGWEPVPEWADKMASVGTESDPDFEGGSDTVQVRVALAGAGPWTITTRVRYQAFTPRHLGALTDADTPESRGLALMLDGRGVPAELLAEQQVVVSR